MISGFFLYKKDGIGTDRLTRVLKHISVIALWSSLFYICWGELMAMKEGGVFVPTARQFIKWIFLNEFPFAMQLWYLYAYIYVLLVVMAVDRYHKWNQLFMAAPVLLLPNIVFYFLPYCGVNLTHFFVRNFLFTGLPFFAIGAMIKSAGPTHRIRRFGSLWWVLALAAISCAEGLLPRQGDELDLYLSTPFLSISLFCMFLSMKVEKPNLLSKIGQRDSLYIYIFHILFITKTISIGDKLGLGPAMGWIAPLAVFAVTLAVVVVCRTLFALAKRAFGYCRFFC